MKGEIVLVIDGPGEAERCHDAQEAAGSAAERAAELIGAGELSRKDIVKRLRKEFGVSRNEAYDIVMQAGR